MRKVSLRKMKAAWKNGAKSTGLSTLEAKSKIAPNARKHGLTAKAILLPGEDPEAFRDFADSFHAIYQPQCDDEFLLVEEMIACKWKLRRAWGFESTVIRAQMLEDHGKVNEKFENAGPDVHAALAFKALADQSNALTQIHRQETRLTRLHDHNLDRLLELQAARSGEDQAQAPSCVPAGMDTPKNPPSQSQSNLNKSNIVPIEKPILQNNPTAPETHPPQGEKIE